MSFISPFVSKSSTASSDAFRNISTVMSGMNTPFLPSGCADGKSSITFHAAFVPHRKPSSASIASYL